MCGSPWFTTPSVEGIVSCWCGNLKCRVMCREHPSSRDVLELERPAGPPPMFIALENVRVLLMQIACLLPRQLSHALVMRPLHDAWLQIWMLLLGLLLVRANPPRARSVLQHRGWERTRLELAVPMSNEASPELCFQLRLSNNRPCCPHCRRRWPGPSADLQLESACHANGVEIARNWQRGPSQAVAFEEPAMPIEPNDLVLLCCERLLTVDIAARSRRTEWAPEQVYETAWMP